MPLDQSTLASHIVDQFLDEQELPVTPAHACPYLPGLTTTSQAFCADSLEPEIYAALMDRGFRRSGRLIYRPACTDCRACQQMRVPVVSFRMSRSQRRVWRKNQDIDVHIGKPELTDEKWRLFSAYLASQHDGTMSNQREDVEEFLYQSPVDSSEICYRLGRSLIAVSVVDCFKSALSSVYVYFDPAHHKRSPGTLSALWEIDYCRQQHIEHYYLGYYVAGAKTMAYKANFTPNEVLGTDGGWHSL